MPLPSSAGVEGHFVGMQFAPAPSISPPHVVSPHAAPGAVSGELSPRSSHRAVGVPGGLMIFGGAVDRGEKSNDLMLLTVGGHSRLTWRACLPPSDSAGSHAGAVGWPGARGAHAAEVVCGRLYVLGGYGEGKKYTGGRGYAAWKPTKQGAQLGTVALPLMRAFHLASANACSCGVLLAQLTSATQCIGCTLCR